MRRELPLPTFQCPTQTYLGRPPSRLLRALMPGCRHTAPWSAAGIRREFLFTATSVCPPRWSNDNASQLTHIPVSGPRENHRLRRPASRHQGRRRRWRPSRSRSGQGRVRHGGDRRRFVSSVGRPGDLLADATRTSPSASLTGKLTPFLGNLIARQERWSSGGSRRWESMSTPQSMSKTCSSSRR